jgi:hypothetical protein
MVKIKIALLIAVALLVTGCGNKIKEEPVMAITETEETVVPGTPTIEEVVIEPAVVEPDEIIPVKEEEIVVIESLPRPSFVRGELDLSAITEDTLVIRILYFNEDGEPDEFSIPGGEGWMSVRIWAGKSPSEENAVYLLSKNGKHYYEYMIESDQDIVEIPVSEILPTEDKNVTVAVKIPTDMWYVNFGPDTLMDVNDCYSQITKTIERYW